jgi:glycosyltransferase involved in cell wall biosynthesis
MRVCVITDIVSPHQMPLAQELAKHLGREGFRYVATSEPQLDRVALGWKHVVPPPEWVLQPAVNREDRAQAFEWGENADIVLCGIRDLELFERRCRSNKATLYMSERWFKPPVGIMRLGYPLYFRRAWRLFRLLSSPRFYYLPIGFHAAADMCRVVSLLSRFPPHSTSFSLCDKQRLWGYFVGPSENRESLTDSTDARMNSRTKELFRILWFGRLIDWKRTDLLIETVKRLTQLPGLPISLKIIGHGPMETQLRKKVSDLGLGACVEFCPPKPILEIRTAIRDADVCVVTSNALEGWGVAVNEGLIEGRCVIASDATGAGATLIQDGVNGLLFKSGSHEDLTRQLQRVREDRVLLAHLGDEARKAMLDGWSPTVAAERLVAFSESLLTGNESARWNSGPLSSV